jgi:hypothetical protein
VGRSVLGAKVARAAKFRKNHGMRPWHGVCGTPGHDRSNDLVGPAGGGEASGASAPSAGGSPPPAAAYTSVAAHFNLRHGSAVGGVLLLRVGDGRRDDWRGRSPGRGPCQPMRGALGAPHCDPGCRGSTEARTATAFPRQRSDLSRPHFLRLFFFGGVGLYGLVGGATSAPARIQPPWCRRAGGSRAPASAALPRPASV